MLIDIDHFKALNDHDGHLEGDRILRDCAEAWGAALRPSDTLARIGGDEFAVLLPACTLVDAREIIERLRAATPVGVTVSIGLAEHEAGDQRDELLSRANQALYVAKTSGRNQLHAGTRENLAPAQV